MQVGDRRVLENKTEKPIYLGELFGYKLTDGRYALMRALVNIMPGKEGLVEVKRFYKDEKRYQRAKKRYFKNATPAK